MAPDINSLPQSPRQQQASPVQPSQPTSRRPSRQMPPPPVPQAHRSPTMSANEHPGIPMRHPRPLTAAEVFEQCEKDQEAVVNRLTRELTALRAQSASVASNASQSSNSTSASLLPVDIGDPNPAHQLTGATHPTPSRQRRSSSSLSGRSMPPTPGTSASITGSSITNASTQAHAGSTLQNTISQASADRAAATRTLSRQPSISAASGTSTPARTSLDIARGGPGGSYTLPHRPSLSRDPSYMSQTTTASSTAAHAGTPLPQSMQNLPSPAQSSPSQSTTMTNPHYTEMEIVKAENEALRQRVRALERALQARDRRDSNTSDSARVRGHDVPSPVEPTRLAISPGVAAWAGNDGGVGGVAGPRERSESQSTTASSTRRGLLGNPGEDEVRLGESAGSVGVGRGV